MTHESQKRPNNVGETMADADRLSDTILQEIGHLEFNYIDESDEELIEEVSRILEKKFIFM